ncbi:hypothetical protein N7468_007193 [Penicillium chermesinum]|uniref:Required for respiratory growth protein 7, mitochondrial n=1 Tax=Penicillium chermesinum TaxID=63820 RepID=A0A9W9NW27_9EURO|nr:uncharacterized protein N7468_007193 [Penicillium chermesinum]KAJ5225968.1 hypothetical protein N7468_007193 [Penicillium chermesinum]
MVPSPSIGIAKSRISSPQHAPSLATLSTPNPPSAPSQDYTSLSTFLSYASRIGLPKSSTVYIGTHYEYTVQERLRRAGLALDRIGGRDDAGIDLLGTWHLPERTGRRALRVLVQCKALRTKLGPNLVRELEGALRQPPVGWRTGQTVGVLVSPREATKGVRDALARSSFPLFWMMVERDGALRQALWNARAEELGLGPLAVETRYAIAGMELRGAEERWVDALGQEFRGIENDVLLDAVEKVFPDGIPGLEVDGIVSEEDRSRVRQVLQERSSL